MLLRVGSVVMSSLSRQDTAEVCELANGCITACAYRLALGCCQFVGAETKETVEWLAQAVEIARRNKEIIERVMTRVQIAEATRLGREWIETHSQHGGN